MKKILLLGGSRQQVVAIEMAKKLGYYTILCDYLPDNPGQNYADKFYLESTTDKEAILKIAEKEKIDGIVAYASDPAAPTAAYVAEKLGLPTNPYNSVNILCNKDMFREFLEKNGFFTPKAKGYSGIEEAKTDLEKKLFQFPVLIKPVDSSGSKGIAVIKTPKNNIIEELQRAFESSKSKRIVIEEFVEKDHKYLIGGDIFVQNGQIILLGLLNCHRDKNVNELVPVGKSYPLELEDKRKENIKSYLQMIVDKLKMKNGAMNVELIIDKEDHILAIDIGPRNGGNMIPDFLKLIFQVDVVEATILVSLGENFKLNCKENKNFYASHNLHVNKDGILGNINISEKLKKYIVFQSIYKKQGDKIEYFENASKVLGIIFMSFPSKQEMDFCLDNIYNFIKIEVK